VKKGNKKLSKHRVTTTPTVLESGHAARRPARQEELVKAPENATTVNAPQQRNAPAKCQMEAAESVKQKLPEPAKPVADPAEQKRAELLDEFVKFSVAAGIRNVHLADLLFTQMNAMQLWGMVEDKIDRTLAAVSALREMDPRNATEALLACPDVRCPQRGSAVPEAGYARGADL
jgi:hypothetical protein